MYDTPPRDVFRFRRRADVCLGLGVAAETSSTVVDSTDVGVAAAGVDVGDMALMPPPLPPVSMPVLLVLVLLL